MAFRSTRNPTGRGWVYVLTNPAYAGLVKIGCTGRDPETRAAELSAGTGVPARFVVAWSHPVRDWGHEALEALAHGRLAKCRANDNREFFRCTVGEARRIIEQEARAQLLPWWSRLLHRLAHLLPSPARPAWRSAPPGRRPSRRRSPDGAWLLMLPGVALGWVVVFRPAWVPPGLLHLLWRLPGLHP